MLFDNIHKILVVLAISLIMSKTAWPSPIWSGYINDRSTPGDRYGYIETVSTVGTGVKSKLRLTCYPPQGFRIYIDEKLLGQSIPSEIPITIDTLPTELFQLNQHGPRFFITNRGNQGNKFWILIAQMIAGSEMRLQLAASENYSYSLSGFTSAYTKNCSWIPDAKTYDLFIDNYK